LPGEPSSEPYDALTLPIIIGIGKFERPRLDSALFMGRGEELFPSCIGNHDEAWES
jgi:hypothetical protein